jgi:allantoinase
MDDQPVWLATRGGRLLSVPYPQELNDSAAIIARQVDAHTFSTMVVDQFDEMREQSRDGVPLVMGIALHAMIAGQPFRVRALRRALEHIARHRDEVWLTTAGGIAQHFARA